MNDLLSYLTVQARHRPASTVRFVAGEIWRRSRAKLHQELDRALPELCPADFAAASPLFLPPILPDFRAGVPARWMEQTLERAENAVRGEIEVFGALVSLGAEPDWQCDWQSGHRWPLSPAGSVRVLEAPPGADVKRPWEAARFHHALALGAAAALTREQRFVDAFAAQARHWMEHNPWPRGIHWATPMEVGLRAINWIQAAAFCSAAGLWDAQTSREVSRSLFLHGRHLWAYREWNPVARANHYLACVVALLWLGALFDKTPEGREWLAFGRRELLYEMECQTAADGMAHEGSSGYHAFVTELFFSGALLLARKEAQARPGAGGAPTNGHMSSAIERATSPQFAVRLTCMFDFLSALCAGREVAPAWGDADDGRVLPFSGTSAHPVAVLCAIGDVLAGRPAGSNGPADPAMASEIYWRFGRVPDAPRLPAHHRSQDFPESGFYFFSSPRIRGSVRCGPLGVDGWSNHAHNDQLSFEFALDGRAVVVDPGLPCYSEDREARNLFRSTRSHNTVEAAGTEQNRFWPALLFRIVDDTQSQCDQWQVDAVGTRFAGAHSGYLRLPQRVRVRRELQLSCSDQLIVRDELEAEAPAAPVEARWFFHLAPEISPEPLGAAQVADSKSSPSPGMHLRIRPQEASGMNFHSCWRLGPAVLSVFASSSLEPLAVRISSGAVAPRFGRKVSAPILEFSGSFKHHSEVSFVFHPEKRAPSNAVSGESS